MCGIAGLFSRSQPPSDPLLRTMTESLVHRGPDGEGYFVNSKVALGHRRLSIIDLEGGQQPVFNEDRSVCAIFNGEIYNFKELRLNLIAKGHKFKSRGDAEVLVHLYEENQEQLVHQLRGMYVFAIWDQRKELLLIGRDPLGMKPLYYLQSNGQFVFASEIRALRRHPSFSGQINHASVHHYLSLMWVPSPGTIYRDVFRLPAGHMVTIGTDQPLRISRFWEPKPKDIEFSSQTEAIEFFEEAFSSAVRSHLVSDVPLGAFLSGGLDSSAVVAYMQRHVEGPIKTFSIGFSGKDYYNELPFARQVASHFKTEHHELIVDSVAQDLLAQVATLFDEPFAVSSAIPTYLLSKHARQTVKVVLTGDGADELLAGYSNRYVADRCANLFEQFVPRSLLQLVGRCGLSISNVPSHFSCSSWANRGLKFCRALSYENYDRYVSYLLKLNEEEKKRLYSLAFKHEINSESTLSLMGRYYRGMEARNLLENRLLGDMTSSLTDEMLTKVDRTTMAVGLEARVPFLDLSVVSAALSLPSHLKLNGLTSKYVLRKLLNDQLPTAIVRRRKHGFEVPVDRWLRTSLKNYALDLLSPAHIASHGFFDPKEVQRYLKEEFEEGVDHGHKLWTILIFQTWYDNVYKGS